MKMIFNILKIIGICLSIIIIVVLVYMAYIFNSKIIHGDKIIHVSSMSLKSLKAKEKVLAQYLEFKDNIIYNVEYDINQQQVSIGPNGHEDEKILLIVPPSKIDKWLFGFEKHKMTKNDSADSDIQFIDRYVNHKSNPEVYIRGDSYAIIYRPEGIVYFRFLE